MEVRKNTQTISHLKTSDGTGVLGGSTLGIVEISGDGNDGLLDLLTEVSLSDGLLHLS